MKSLLIFAVAISLTACRERADTSVLLGVKGGNNEFAIVCEDSPVQGGIRPGWYAADRLHEDAKLAKEDQLVEVKNFGSHLKRIQARLVQMGELDLGRDLNEFMLAIGNNDPEKNYLWEPRALTATVDRIPYFISELAPNCYSDLQTPAIRFTPMVERVLLPSRKIRFYYEPALFEEEKISLLDQSFILVHEWLWNYLDTDQKVAFERNVLALRKLNFSLHKKDFFTGPVDTDRETLKNDLPIAGKTFRPGGPDLNPDDFGPDPWADISPNNQPYATLVGTYRVDEAKSTYKFGGAGNVHTADAVKIDPGDEGLSFRFFRNRQQYNSFLDARYVSPCDDEKNCYVFDYRHSELTYTIKLQLIDRTLKLMVEGSGISTLYLD